MKKYQTKPTWVEAIQYDGTWEFLKELKKIDSCSITCDNNNHYFNNIRLTKDCWIVKQIDIVESSEAGEDVYEFIVMRDDQFAERYEDVSKVRIHEPHKFKFGGKDKWAYGEGDPAVSFIKLYFFDGITVKRAKEIAQQLQEHITKD